MNREKELINVLHKELCKQISFKMGANSSYTQKQILSIAIYASVEHISAESASKELEGMPSADDVLYHMNKQNLNTIQSCVDSLMSYSLRRARKHFRIPRTKKLTTAIDFHEIPYYGNRNGEGMRFWVVGSKRKGGTNYFLRYATVDIVHKGMRFTLFVLPVSVFKTTEKAIHALVEAAKKHVNVNLVLLDRAFCNIKSIKKLEALGVSYVMPKPMDKKTKKVVKECLKNSITSMRYRMGTKKNFVEFNLIVYKDANTKDAVAFATNKSTDPAWTAETYRRRWGIETGYRVKKDFRAKTTSTSHNVRVIYFLLSVILYNLWVLCNLIIDAKVLMHNTTKKVYTPSVTTRTICIEMRRIVESDVS
jgi:hypothetical protein